jgi:hypothetical protein
VTIPVSARLTAHRKSACWAPRRLDGPTTNLRYQSRGLRSKWTDTADDLSRWCQLPQRLHTLTPNVPAGQRSQSPASTVAGTRTSRRIPGGLSAPDSVCAFTQVTGLRPKVLRTAKRRRFDTPIGYTKRASGPRFRRSSEALSRTRWQVKDSNLRSFRDGFTVHERQAGEQRRCLSTNTLPCVFPTDSRLHPTTAGQPSEQFARSLLRATTSRPNDTDPSRHG